MGTERRRAHRDNGHGETKGTQRQWAWRENGHGEMRWLLLGEHLQALGVWQGSTGAASLRSHPVPKVNFSYKKHHSRQCLGYKLFSFKIHLLFIPFLALLSGKLFNAT